MKQPAKWVHPDQLHEWPGNPRANDDAVASVKASIERFGFGAPVLARSANKEIIAGHTRWKAAKELGLTRIPVRFMDLSEEEAHALSLADNKLGELASWVDDDLNKALLDLANQEIDLSGLGWTDTEVQARLERIAVSEHTRGTHVPDDGKDDQLPGDVEPITKPGDTIELGQHVIRCADCMEVLAEMDDDSVDAIVTDPPYQISFMGKKWDQEFDTKAWAEQCLRVLKPGGHILAFAATRTIHWLMVALEEAGFEIRDMIAWCQWQGFPKNHDISKAIDDSLGAERSKVKTAMGRTGNKYAKGLGDGRPWMQEAAERGYHEHAGPDAVTEEAKRWEGWGSALKPAIEPIALARKPLGEKTLAQNVLKWGTGGLNIGGCRFAYGDPAWVGPQEGAGGWGGGVGFSNAAGQGPSDKGEPRPHEGRWPANLYYCPKPHRGEREAGLEGAPVREGGSYEFRQDGSLDGKRTAAHANLHPTVKAVKLMRWLSRLVTPPGGTLIDPFLGSGTTMIAAHREGFRCIGIEREPQYVDIARARVQHALGEDLTS